MLVFLPIVVLVSIVLFYAIIGIVHGHRGIKVNPIIVGKFIKPDLSKTLIPGGWRIGTPYKYIMIKDKNSELDESRVYYNDYWIGASRLKPRHIYICSHNIVQFIPGKSSRKLVDDYIGTRVILKYGGLDYIRILRKIYTSDNMDMVLEVENVDTGETETIKIEASLMFRSVILSMSV